MFESFCFLLQKQYGLEWEILITCSPLLNKYISKFEKFCDFTLVFNMNKYMLYWTGPYLTKFTDKFPNTFD